MYGDERLAPKDTESQEGKGLVADTGSQAPWTLSLLWCQRQHAIAQSVLPYDRATDAKMAEPSQSTQAFLLERFHFIFETLSPAETSYCSQLLYAVASDVSFTEEPDVGNPQVRFCEGH